MKGCGHSSEGDFAYFGGFTFPSWILSILLFGTPEFGLIFQLVRPFLRLSVSQLFSLCLCASVAKNSSRCDLVPLGLVVLNEHLVVESVDFDFDREHVLRELK